jgi:hypothetical protein
LGLRGRGVGGDFDPVGVPDTLNELGQLVEYLDSARSWENRREFSNYFVRGWVRPDKLPPGESFQFTTEWFDFFRELSNSREFGDIKITGALYRDWIFLEKYQESCISKCREAEETSR